MCQRAPLILLLLLLAAPGGLSGCASRGKIEYSGFLQSYEGLKPAPRVEGALSWRKAGADLGAYDRLIIEPIEVFYHPEADYKGIRPDQLSGLADTLFLAFSRAMLDRYPLTRQPGPRTLVMRSALVNLRANSTRGTVMTTLSGERRTTEASGVRVTAYDLDLFVKEVGIEAEFFDSMTGERLFAFVDKDVSGTHLGDNLSDLGVIKRAFKEWAEALRAAFDESRPSR